MNIQLRQVLEKKFTYYDCYGAKLAIRYHWRCILEIEIRMRNVSVFVQFTLNNNINCEI